MNPDCACRRSTHPPLTPSRSMCELRHRQSLRKVVYAAFHQRRTGVEPGPGREGAAFHLWIQRMGLYRMYRPGNSSPRSFSPHHRSRCGNARPRQHTNSSNPRAQIQYQAPQAQQQTPQPLNQSLPLPPPNYMLRTRRRR